MNGCCYCKRNEDGVYEKETSFQIEGLLVIRLHRHIKKVKRENLWPWQDMFIFRLWAAQKKTRSLPFPFEKESQFWLLSTHQKRVKIVEVIHDVLEQDTMDPIVQKVLSIFYITCSIYWHSNHFMSILCLSLYFRAKELGTFLGLKRSFRKRLFFLSSP